MHKEDYYPIEKENSTCWIYILKQKDDAYSIRFTFDLDRSLSNLSVDSRLVYSHGFQNPMESIAYKSLLENLSFESVSRIIAFKNPKFENRSEAISK